MHKNRREGSEKEMNDDGTYVYMRAEDRSNMMRLSYVYDKYKPLIMLTILFLGAAGFGFRTPKSIFNELKAQQSATNVHVTAINDSLNNRVKRLEGIALKVDALIRVKCVELKHTPDILKLAGLDCTEWMKEVNP